jgi:hypothetical protein
MPLKAVLDTLEGLNEDHRGLYVEDDGKFFLDIEADTIKDHPATRPIKVALDRLKGEVSDKQTRLADALAKLEAKPAPTKADDAEMVRLRQALEKERDDAITERDGLRKEVYGYKVESVLEAELRSGGVTDPAFLRAAKRDIAEKVTLVDGKAVVQTADLGDFSASDYVKRYLAGEGKAFVSKPQGGGAQPATGTGGKTISASQLDGMTPQEKAAFYKANPGVKVV